MLIRKAVYISLILTSFVFTVWVYTKGTSLNNVEINMTKTEFEGRKLWNKNNCIACHQVYGLGGYLGPDLTNIISHRGEDYTKAILKTGTAKMPNFNFTENEIQFLVAYLKYTNNTGSANPKNYKINWYGSFEKK